MARLKENDFSEKVKRTAGCSVAYRCSFDGCDAILVCRREGSNEIETIAEYCHIAAASPNGPRFDSSLTSEEISSLDNCIVMCRNHHHIIDSNPSKYTTEILKKWKAEKEERTRVEMTNGSSCLDSNQVEAIFDSYIKNGNYDVLYSKLEDYKKMGNSQLYEVVDRYEIYLQNLLGFETDYLVDDYIKRGYKNFNRLAEFFIEFDNKKALKKIENYIEDLDVKNIVTKIANTDTQIIIKDTSISDLIIKCGNKMNIKFVMNYTFRQTDLPLYLKDKNGKDINLYESEFYYELISFFINLRKVKFSHIDLNYDYMVNNISQYIDYVDKFETKVKCKIYNCILEYFGWINSDLFYYYFNRLNENEKKENSIEKTYFKHELYVGNDIKFEDILEYSKKTKDYELLCGVLSSNLSSAKVFLEDNRYLLKENSIFLLLYHDCSNVDSFRKTVKSLEPFYKDDFTFNCIKWDLDAKNNDLKEWCIKNEDKISGPSINLYFKNLILANENDHFLSIIDNVNNVDTRAQLLLYFSAKNKEKAEYYDILIEKYKKIDNEKLIKGINHNLGVMLYKKDKIKAAIKCLEKEIDGFNTRDSIDLLLNYRLEKGIYIKDKYFSNCLNSNEYFDLIYAAETYYNCDDLNNALLYYEKALLTGENNIAILNKIFDLTNKDKINDCEEIDDNTAIAIECEGDSKIILFHKSNVLEHMICKNNKWIDAYLDNTEYSFFRYLKLGEEVQLNNKKYKIVSIDNLYKFYSKEFIKSISFNKNAITISGTPENAINQLTEFIQKQSERSKELENKFLETKDILPLSALSKLFFGDKIIKTIIHCTNKSKNKFNNNQCFVSKSLLELKKVFYYDSIFVLFELYKKIKFSIPDTFYITGYVRTRLNNEINERIRDIKNGSSSIGLDENGKVVRYQIANNRTKADFLQELASFKSFISMFKDVDFKDYDLIIDGIKLGNDVIKFEDEKSILSVLNENESFVAVCDSPALTKLCELLGMKSIGVTQLISFLFRPCEIIDSALILKDLNYNNYFTLNMYLSVKSDCSQELNRFIKLKFDDNYDNIKQQSILKQLALSLEVLNITDNFDSELLNGYFSH